MTITLGDIAGIIAAVAFVALVGFLARPLLGLGKVMDSARESIDELTEHAVPILDEAATTVSGANGQLERVDAVTSSAANVSQNLSALTSLVTATVGGPLVKVASFTYAVRATFANRSGKGQGAGQGTRPPSGKRKGSRR